MCTEAKDPAGGPSEAGGAQGGRVQVPGYRGAAQEVLGHFRGGRWGFCCFWGFPKGEVTGGCSRSPGAGTLSLLLLVIPSLPRTDSTGVVE